MERKREREHEEMAINLKGDCGREGSFPYFTKKRILLLAFEKRTFGLGTTEEGSAKMHPERNPESQMQAAQPTCSQETV